MEKTIKNAIETYQCPGCIKGHNISCFEADSHGSGCSAHRAGTFMMGIGSFYLGMPKGVNRTGKDNNCPIHIFKTYDSAIEESENYFTKFTVGVWKHLNKAGHTLVRVYCPRVNRTMILIFLEDCMDRIEAITITENDINEMD